jgi:hypothetical protein
MSSITDSVGEGWDKRKILKIFNERNNIVNGQEEEVRMTTSKHFEQAYITLSTMTKIKLTTKKGKEIHSPLNVICPPLNLKKKQFASNML